MLVSPHIESSRRNLVNQRHCKTEPRQIHTLNIVFAAIKGFDCIGWKGLQNPLELTLTQV